MNVIQRRTWDADPGLQLGMEQLQHTMHQLLQVSNKGSSLAHRLLAIDCSRMMARCSFAGEAGVNRHMEVGCAGVHQRVDVMNLLGR